MNRFLTFKYKAGALQYAIFASVLIALLITSLISIVYLNQKLIFKLNYFEENISSVNQAFKSLSSLEINYKQPVILQERDNQLEIYRRNWGVFDIVDISSRNHHEFFRKIAFTGNSIDEKQVLFLVDNDRPIILAGDTFVSGNASLPHSGIKAGNIKGQTYNGKELIYGKIEYSSNKLPKLLNRDYLMEINKDFSFMDKKNISLNNQSTIYNSFKDTTGIYFKPSIIDLGNTTLIGNIIIKSDTLIRIGNGVTLKDVMIIAPNIDISSQVTGNFQAIATNSIRVAKNVKLKYPSALVLINNEGDFQNITTKTDSKNIYVDENSVIEGVIVYLTKNIKLNEHNPNVYISKNTTVNGSIYCEHNLELRGRVYGNIFTHSFITNESGVIYYNYILDAEINRKKLSDVFAGLSIENQENKVIQWLY